MALGHAVIGNNAVGHTLSAGAVLSCIGTWVGRIEPIVSFVVLILAGLWYILTMYEGPTCQKWIEKRHARKLAKDSVSASQVVVQAATAAHLAAEKASDAAEKV